LFINKIGLRLVVVVQKGEPEKKAKKLVQLSF
jgi:hypothetical protein